MSSFSSLQLSLTSLMAQRRAMDVTGQNIANANTAGYTRQRADLQSLPGPVSPAAIYATWNGVGQGVEVTGVNRINDAFLDARARVEGGTLALNTERAAVLSRVEGLLAEPSDSGLSAQLDDFWGAWQDLANNTGDPAARSQLLERGATVADTLGTASRNVDSQARATADQAAALTQQVNTTAANIAQLNAGIRAQTQAGRESSDLMDQRDLLVRQLSDLAGADVQTSTDGMINVTLGGETLVSGVTANAFTLTTTPDGNGVPGGPVTTTVGGTAMTLSSGRLTAVSESISTVLPRMRDDLDAVADRLMTTVNAAHQGGYGLPPVGSPAGTPGPTGLNFFSGTSAATLQVAITNPRDIAASGAVDSELGNGNADAIAQLAESTNGADALWKQTVVDVGVRADSANRRASVQQVVSAQADSARLEVSGVSIDEEMTNLLMFQRAYEGSARVLSAVDSMLDTLINRTGLVGR